MFVCGQQYFKGYEWIGMTFYGELTVKSTSRTLRSVMIHGSIHVMHVLACMARADKMDAHVSIWWNIILVGEMSYIKVIRRR